MATYSEQVAGLQNAASGFAAAGGNTAFGNPFQVAADRIASSPEAIAERREDTAVQRAVDDMKSAGINPILGFTGTGAASSASSSAQISSQAQLKAAKIAGVFSIISSALGLASDVAFPAKHKHFGFGR